VSFVWAFVRLSTPLVERFHFRVYKATYPVAPFFKNGALARRGGRKAAPLYTCQYRVEVKML
jgi:hypothetical protein